MHRSTAALLPRRDQRWLGCTDRRPCRAGSRRAARESGLPALLILRGCGRATDHFAFGRLLRCSSGCGCPAGRYGSASTFTVASASASACCAALARVLPEPTHDDLPGSTFEDILSMPLEVAKRVWLSYDHQPTRRRQRAAVAMLPGGCRGCGMLLARALLAPGSERLLSARLACRYVGQHNCPG